MLTARTMSPFLFVILLTGTVYSCNSGGGSGGGGSGDLKDDLRKEYNRNPGKYRDKYIHPEHWYVPAGVRH